MRIDVTPQTVWALEVDELHGSEGGVKATPWLSPMWVRNNLVIKDLTRGYLAEYFKWLVCAFNDIHDWIVEPTSDLAEAFCLVESRDQGLSNLGAGAIEVANCVPAFLGFQLLHWQHS
jgi:hypothetical protein